ncbi:MAG: hypothetical protein QME12_09310, partial [Nanoarchaeota archaeon]|nr:hypothetical protein [Nanoarchaeota archaeon]
MHVWMVSIGSTEASCNFQEVALKDKIWGISSDYKQAYEDRIKKGDFIFLCSNSGRHIDAIGKVLKT